MLFGRVYSFSSRIAWLGWSAYTPTCWYYFLWLPILWLPMPDVPRYWTPAYIEAFVEALNEDDEFQRTARGFSESLSFRCLDTPDGEDMEAIYTFEDGEVVDVDLWVDDAPSEELRADPFDSGVVLARATASYETWCKLDRGELGVMQALASPDYQVEGSKLRIMANIGVIMRMGTVSSSVRKTY